MSKIKLKVNSHFRHIHETMDFKIMLCIGSYGSVNLMRYLLR